MKDFRNCLVLIMGLLGSCLANATDIAIPGLMAGQATVTPAGSAHYSLPLTIPKSLGGFGPSLSVEYTSGSQDSSGLMGIGWTLKGLAQITRCPQTLAQDGQVQGVQFNSNDRFCLNGQRLVVVNGLQYGANGAEYRTEIDSATRVISYVTNSNATYFDVWTKDGLIEEFGNTPDSKLDINGGEYTYTNPNGVYDATPSPATVQAWGLDQVTDRNGNYWTVTYDTTNYRNASSVLYPSIISYTGNGSTAPNNSIQIVYETRPEPDISYQFQAGSLVSQSSRITTIKSYVGTSTEASEYRFSYQLSSAHPINGPANHSRLAQIQECHYSGGASYCLDPTVVNWVSDEAQIYIPGMNGPLLSPQTTLTGSTISPNFMMSADVSGDGRSDLILPYYSSGTLMVTSMLAQPDVSGVANASFGAPITRSFTGTFPSLPTGASPQFVLADLNGDGKADLVAAFLSGNSSYSIYTYLSNGDGTFTAQTPYTIATSVPLTSNYRFLVKDINGDGIPDFVSIRGNASCDGTISCSPTQTQTTASGEVRVVLRNADGTLQPEQESPLDLSAWPNSNIQDMTVADINGDGIPDAVFTVQVANTAAGAHTPYTTPTGGQAMGYTPTGDYGVYIIPGSAPLGGLGGSTWFSGATTTRTAVYGTQLNAVPFPCGGSAVPPVGSYFASLMDVNRDGLVDVLLDQTVSCYGTVHGTVNAGWIQAISTGISDGKLNFTLKGGLSQNYSTNTSNNSMPQSLTQEWTPIYQDFDGNGTLDVMRFGVDSNNKWWGLLTVGFGTGDFSITTTNFEIGGSPVGSGIDDVIGGDVNADGVPDVVLMSPNNITVLRAMDDVNHNLPKQQNLVTSICRGPNSTGTCGGLIANNFTYTTLPSNMGSSNPLYTECNGVVCANSSYPQLDTNMPLVVVNQASTSLNGTAQSTATYQYTGAKLDLHGRGFLGFNKVTATTTQIAGSQTITTVNSNTYRQDFPYTGMPIDSTHTVNNVLVSETKSNTAVGDTTCNTSPVVTVTNDFSCTNTYTGVYLPQVNGSTTSSYDPTNVTSTLLGGTRNAQTFDVYGNTLKDTVTQQNAAIGQSATFSAVTTTANTYLTNTTSPNWVVNFLSTQSTTAQRTVNGVAGPGITHQSAYTYDSHNNLYTATKEPNVGSLSVLTTYGRDTYGNITSTQVGNSSATSSSNSIVTRTATALYGACLAGAACAGTGPGYLAGTFKTSDTTPADAQGTTLTSSYTYDPLTGAQLTATDPNGLKTTVTVDAVGREINRLKPDGTSATTSYNACVSPVALGTGTTSCETGEYEQVIATPYNSTPAVSGAPAYSYLDPLGRNVRNAQLSYDGTDYNIVRSEYDAIGRSLRTSRPALNTVGYSNLQWTSNTYDAVGRTLTVTTPAGVNTTSYSGLTVTQTNAESPAQTRIETRTITGETTQIQDAAGNKLIYGLDDLGRITSTTDPKGNQVVFTLDPYGNKTQQIDPDLGTINYLYDVLGELIWQQDARELATTPISTATTFTYDLLGRQLSRSEPDLISNWIYDTAANGLGKLATETANNGYERDFAYDSYSRPITDTTKKAIDPNAQTTDPNFVYTTTYDNAGRVSTLTYPSGFSYQNIYNANGYLQGVVNANTQVPYWTANTRDALGDITQETLGNGLVTSRTYSSTTALISNIVTGTVSGSSNSGNIQSDAYSFDALGNLLYRNYNFGTSGSSTDPYTTVSESFTYDNLNRVTSNTLANSNGLLGLKTVSYDVLGNIINRSDVGTYTYGASGTSGCTGPHQVCTISGLVNTSYTYDANGNTASGNGRTYTVDGTTTGASAWTSYNMPSIIAQGSTTDCFLYTADHERVVQQSGPAATPGSCNTIPSNALNTTVYINPRIDTGGTFEKDYLANGTSQYVNTVYAGAYVVGSVITPTSQMTGSLWSTAFPSAPSTSPNADGITAGVSPTTILQWCPQNGSGTAACPTTTLPTALAFHTYLSTVPGSDTAEAYWSQHGYTKNQSVVSTLTYNSGVTATGTPAGPGRYASFNMQSNSTGSNFGVYFRGTELILSCSSAHAACSNNNVLLNGAIADNTTYIIQITTGPGSNSVTVYPQGSPSAGWSASTGVINWDPNNVNITRQLLFNDKSDTGLGDSTSTVDDVSYLTNISESTFSTHYFHTDHLGSITATTDDTGTVIERFSYDAWGKRRHTDGSDDMGSTPLWTPTTFPSAPSTSPNADGITAAVSPTTLLQWCPQNGSGTALCPTTTLPTALAIHTYVTGGSSTAEAYWGQHGYTKNQSVVSTLTYNSGVTATGTPAGPGRYASFNVQSNSTGSSFGVYFRGTELILNCSSNHTVCSNNNVKLTSAIADNITYIIQITTGPSGNSVTAYPQGNPSAGWSISTGVINWDPNNVNITRQLLLGDKSDTGAGDSSSTVDDVSYLTSISESTIAEQNSITALATDTDHGYTEQEMLDSVALIHMNGRVYDPMVGRFLSADPNVFYPDTLQDFNRYSYVHDNPLSNTDPSGFDDCSDFGFGCNTDWMGTSSISLGSTDTDMSTTSSFASSGYTITMDLGNLGVTGTGDVTATPGANNADGDIGVSQATTLMNDESLAGISGQGILTRPDMPTCVRTTIACGQQWDVYNQQEAAFNAQMLSDDALEDITSTTVLSAVIGGPILKGILAPVLGRMASAFGPAAVNTVTESTGTLYTADYDLSNVFDLQVQSAADTASVATPYGAALQSTSSNALAALQQAQSGITLYRAGAFGVQNTADAQFWAFENPLTASDYAGQMGMPGSASPSFDWVMAGKVPPGGQVITREAPGLGVNAGGQVEAVVPAGGINIQWFHMP